MKPSVDVFFSRQVSPRPVLSRSRRQRRVGHLRGGKKARLSGRSHGRGRSLPERRAVPAMFPKGAHRWRCVGRKRPLVVLDPAFGEGHAPKLIWGGPLKPRFLFLFCYFSSALSALARSIDLGWRTIYSLSSGIPSLSAVRIKKETPLFVKLGAAVRSRGYRWSGASTQRPYVSSEFLKKKVTLKANRQTRGALLRLSVIGSCATYLKPKTSNPSFMEVENGPLHYGLLFRPSPAVLFAICVPYSAALVLPLSM